MVTLFDCLVLVMVSTLAEAQDLSRVHLAYNAAYEACKGITDVTHESRTSADKVCDQAFRALDDVKLNSCSGWRLAGCRMISKQDTFRQCTCLASYCDNTSVQSNKVTPFHACAAALWAHEQVNRQIPAPTTNLQQTRSFWLSAQSHQSTFISPGFSGGSGSSTGLPSTSGTGYSTSASGVYGYKATSAAYPLNNPGAPQNQPKAHTCNECGVVLMSERDLFYHKKDQHFVSDTHCYLCNSDYTYRRGLLDHLRRKHPVIAAEEAGSSRKRIQPEVEEGQTTFPCKLCKKRYTSHRALIDHLKCHTDDTTCPVCKRPYSTRSNLKLHMQDQHPGVPLPELKVTKAPSKEAKNGPFVCEKCGKSYTYKKGLQQHMFSHDTLDTYCIFCEKPFGSKQAFLAHTQKRHPITAEIYQENASRRREMEKPFECGICHNRFKYAESLRVHMGSHKG